jgi:hypothetical protein
MKRMVDKMSNKKSLKRKSKRCMIKFSKENTLKKLERLKFQHKILLLSRRRRRKKENL